MRTLYCVQDFGHERFQRVVDGGFHRLQVFNADKSELLAEEASETVVESHPFTCAECGAPVIDFDSPHLSHDLRLLINNLESGIFSGSDEARRQFFDTVKTVQGKDIPALLNALSKALWF